MWVHPERAASDWVHLNVPSVCSFGRYNKKDYILVLIDVCTWPDLVAAIKYSDNRVLPTEIPSISLNHPSLYITICSVCIHLCLPSLLPISPPLPAFPLHRPTHQPRLCDAAGPVSPLFLLLTTCLALPRAPAVPPSRLSPPPFPPCTDAIPPPSRPSSLPRPSAAAIPPCADAIPPHRAAVPPRATAVPPCTDAIPPPSRLSSLPRHLPPLLSLALMPSRRIPAALPPPATAVLPHSAAVPPCVE
jgi:hypothetical protein